MSNRFSWSDTFQIAFSSCLSCLKHSESSGGLSSPSQQNLNDPTINRIPRARHDELQGLLLDPDTDNEAETLSLHSNPGRSRRGKDNAGRSKRTKKKGGDNPRSITLFGYNLFGVPSGGVQLPDDGDDALYNESRPQPHQDGRDDGTTTRNTILTGHSNNGTFDTDAAPLDSAAIDALSSPTAVAAAEQAAAEAEAQRRKEKEERRQRRREKKEMKRLAEAIASGQVDGGEFEGFQGSGDILPNTRSSSGYPYIHDVMRIRANTASDSGSGSNLSGSGKDDFGRFVSAPPLLKTQRTMDDEDDDAVDLDGGLYAQKTSRDGPTGGGSDSRSRTSASASERGDNRDRAAVIARVRHSHSQSLSQSSSSRLNSPSHLQASFQPHPQPLPDLSASDLRSNSTSHRHRSKSANKSHSSSAKSSTTTSQSPSIPSPTSSNFPASVVSPSTVEQGQGFFDLEEEQEVKAAPPSHTKPPTEFPSARLGGGGFPMTGFGSAAAGARRTRDFGAFLARRGDDEDLDGL